jgi:DNA mismatch endonuclease (patch repair protein)
MTDEGALYRAVVVPVAPPASSEAVRAVFKANRRKDTAPELALRRALFARGLRFLVDVTPAGVSKRRRVDVLLRGSRVAVLIHGCFWHCCPEHFVMPVRNREWWETKFSAIKHRDADTVQRLVDAGWLPHIVWEHEDPLAAASRIVELHDSLRSRTGS